MAADSAGNIYVADYCTIRKITAAGVVTTLAGNSAMCGNVNGTGAAALFERPVGAAVDSILFPTIAFGSFLPTIIALQFAAKVAGGALWSIAVKPLVRHG